MPTLPSRGLLLTLALSVCGCAAFRNDLDGIPARHLPEEYRVAPERGKRTIDLTLLRQTPPDAYRIDAGDVLGVFVEGVLGEPKTLPPVYNPSGPFDRPNTGYPITVRSDGTIALPYEGTVPVRGLTLEECEQRLRRFYARERPVPLLKEGRTRVLVSLVRPRTHRVLVVRQESGNRQGNIGSAGTVTFEIDKRGTGRVVELPAYRNDVLNALAETGGLPGLDAQNAIYVIRRPHPSRTRTVPAVATSARSVDPRDDRRTTELWSPPSPHGQPTEFGTHPTVIWQPSGPGAGLRSVVRGQSPDAWSRRHHGNVVRADYRSHDASRGQHVRQLAAESPLPWPVESQPSVTTGQFDSWDRQVTDAWSPLPPDAVPPEQAYVAEDAFAPHPDAIPYVLDDETARSERIVRIPLRMHPGEPVPFRPEDVVLHDGDVVFIETRETEFFFTGGLLGGGQFPLPRDFDLNVLEAIAVVERDGSSRAQLDRSLSGPAVTGLDVTTSASEVIVLRTLPDGREVPIKVDLYEALTNPSERILVAPGDYLFLKYTRSEAWGAWLERWLFDNVANGVNNSRYVTGNQN